MAVKKVAIEGIGEVLLQKRKGSTSLRLSLNHNGQIRVSLPTWSPYKVAEAFVISKRAWIKQQQLHRPQHVFRPNDRIGKAHRLHFIYENRTKVSCRVTQTEIVVKVPLGQNTSDITIQEQVRKAAVRALKYEANSLLPGRLHQLATKYGFSYNQVSIKHLKTRWGSCSSAKDIALNCFLMQLPWELIDYVILHELLHTQIMAHGKPFWDELGHYVPNLAAKRQAMRAHQPALIAAMY